MAKIIKTERTERLKPKLAAIPAMPKVIIILCDQTLERRAFKIIRPAVIKAADKRETNWEKTIKMPEAMARTQYRNVKKIIEKALKDGNRMKAKIYQPYLESADAFLRAVKAKEPYD